MVIGGACGTPGGPSPRTTLPSVAEPARLVPEDVTRWARIIQAVDERRVDLPAITDALEHGHPAVRAAAALGLGQMGAREHASLLHPLLSHRDTATAANAAFAMGLLRDTAGVAVLERALSGPPTVGAEAAWALGEIGEPGRSSIEAALRAGGVPPEVTGALLVAASKLRPVPVDAVVPHLASDEPEVAWRAGYAIARPYAAGGVRALLRHALAPDERMRTQVARALSRPATGDSLAREAIAALEIMLVHPSPHVRIAAIRALATHGESARLQVISGVRDADPGVRVAAAEGTASVMDRDLRRWAWLWDADTSLAYRAAILTSAERAGVIVPDVLHWRGDADWRRRLAVVNAMSSGRDAVRGSSAMIPFLRDADPRVRRGAVVALARQDSAGRHRAALRDALRDTDAHVRAAAIDGLATRAAAAELPLVLAAYRAARADSVGAARVAGARYIRAAWQRDSASIDAASRAELAALPAPEDRAERDALGRFGRGGANGPNGTGRPLEWYEEIVRTLVVPALEERRPLVELHTRHGIVVLELLPENAPLTVFNFLALARRGYYDGTSFHRVVPNFVVQGGDPRGDGVGGPGWTLRDENNRYRYDRGMMGMAHSGPHTAGSQFFITHSAHPHLDGAYTGFGYVRTGMDVIDRIVQGDVLTRVTVR